MAVTEDFSVDDDVYLTDATGLNDDDQPTKYTGPGRIAVVHAGGMLVLLPGSGSHAWWIPRRYWDRTVRWAVAGESSDDYTD